MSASGQYKRPGFRVNEWYGVEKRRTDLLGRLNRELFEVSKEATDPYELAAHLEALGFNSERVSREFSLPSTFELARLLFQMSPRKPELRRRSYIQLPSLGWRQVLILAAIMSTLVLAQSSASSQWLMTLWLITWSIASGSVLTRAKEKLNATRQRSVFALVMLTGFIGIALIGLDQRTLVAYAIAVLWWGVAGAIWLQELFKRNRFWLFGFLLSLIPLLALPALQFPLAIILALQLLLCAFVLLPEITSIKLETLRFVFADTPMLMTQLGYGTGFGLLLIQLIHLFQGNVWVFSALLALFLFLAEWFALGLKNSLADAMWISSTVDDFLQKSLSSSQLVLRYVLLFVFFTLLLFAMFFFPGQAALISHFVLFAITMVLVLMLFALQNVFLPALIFVFAGLASLFSLPLIWIFIALALVLVLILYLQIQRVEEYGFHIIG